MRSDDNVDNEDFEKLLGATNIDHHGDHSVPETGRTSHGHPNPSDSFEPMRSFSPLRIQANVIAVGKFTKKITLIAKHSCARYLTEVIAYKRRGKAPVGVKDNTSTHTSWLTGLRGFACFEVIILHSAFHWHEIGFADVWDYWHSQPGADDWWRLPMIRATYTT